MPGGPGTPEIPQGYPRPQGNPREPQGNPRGPQGTPGEPQGNPGDPSGTPWGPQGNHRGRQGTPPENVIKTERKITKNHINAIKTKGKSQNIK